MSIISCLCLLLLSETMPLPSVSVLPVDTIKDVETERGKISHVSVVGQPFTTAIRAETFKPLPHAWDLQFQYRTTKKIEKDGVLLARFFARQIKKAEGSDAASISVFFETAGPPHDKSLDMRLDIGPEWKEYCFPFRSKNEYEAEKAAFGFHLGALSQTVEIADISLLSFGKDFDIKKLPRTKIGYVGDEPDAAWRKEAEARIDQIRKGDMKIAVKDANGKPIPNAEVQIDMKRHAFSWGSAITANMMAAETKDGEKYRNVVRRYFNRVVFENDMKWGAWENIQQRKEVFRTLGWLEEHKIELRGHCLVWPSWKNTPRGLKELAEQPEKLRERVNAHIQEEVTAFKGRIVDWDVVNEPYDNTDILKILGDDELVNWFKLTKELDPKAKLTLNDYSILSSGGTDFAHQDHFYKTLRFLIDNGAPITSLGIQGHFKGTATPPERMLAILDRFGKLGLDISITEHDIDTEDEDMQANFTRDFLITAFSHPSVSAILTWGFWEGAHWRPEAAFFKKDWTLTPIGETWIELVTKKWWTNAKERTDVNGIAKTRAFFGDYEITLRHDGKTKFVSVLFDKNKSDSITLTLE